MRTLRLFVPLLVFVIPFILAGCKKRGVHQFKQVQVYITNCDAPDQSVNNGDKIDWEVYPDDGHNYTIKFADQNEPTPNPVPVHHGVSNPARPINGNKGCTLEPGGKSHYCKYSLTMDNQSAPCKDPGLHVTP